MLSEDIVNGVEPVADHLYTDLNHFVLVFVEFEIRMVSQLARPRFICFCHDDLGIKKPIL